MVVGGVVECVLHSHTDRVAQLSSGLLLVISGTAGVRYMCTHPCRKWGRPPELEILKNNRWKYKNCPFNVVSLSAAEDRHEDTWTAGIYKSLCFI